MFFLYYLFIGGIYLLIGFFAIRWVLRKLESNKAKVIATFIGVLVWILIPTGDEVAGRIYFNHLCETEAGAKVYQTIELPAEYWDENGKAKFYKGAMSNDVPSYAFNRLNIPVEIRAKDRRRMFHIDQYGSDTIEKDSNKVINEIIGFRYWGGWIARNMTPHNSAVSCRKVAEVYDELIQKQFIPSKAGN